MLTRHKSSWLPNLNRTPKMKPWNALTVEEETASGKNINAKILQNLSAAFLQFSFFYDNYVSWRQCYHSNWRKYFENNFLRLKKNSQFDEVFKFSKLTKNERNFCQTKKKQRFWHRHEMFENCFWGLSKKSKKNWSKI